MNATATIDADPLRDALHALAALVRGTPGPGLFRIRPDSVEIEWGGMRHELVARGDAHLTAVLPADVMRALAAAPPPDDPVVLRVQEGRLAVGGFSAACGVTPGDAPSLLPFDASPAVVLRLGAAHDPAALEAAGLADAVADVRLRARDSAAAAAEHLAWLGVTQEDLLRWLVERARP